MALSYHSNWETSQYLDYTDPMSFIPPEPDLIDMELQQSFALHHNVPCIDPIFNNNSEDYNPLLLPFLSPTYHNLPSLTSEFEPFTCQCRYTSLYPNRTFHYSRPCACDEFFLNPTPVTDVLPVEKLQDFQGQPLVFDVGSGGSMGGGGGLSAQSMAARQRRRKITEKTQELGKLVPGGQKMNTAEMFGAAFKYIKHRRSA